MLSDSSFHAEQLSVSYGSTCILDNISFSVSTGCLCGILGANGSGKTTLLKSICNLIPHSGTSYFNGKALDALSINERANLISYIPQRSGITISMSVLDVVLMGFHTRLRLLEYPGKSMKEKALEALKKVNMEKEKDRDYLSLSEGQKQLVIFARTLVENTNLLLLDEPDSALDFRNKYTCIHMVRQICSEYNKTAILCLHDPILALNELDMLILLKEQRIEQILYPKKDSIIFLQNTLASIYGPVKVSCSESDGFISISPIYNPESHSPKGF